MKEPQPQRSDPNEYPEPTESDLNDLDFNAVWNAIKDWDLSRYRETETDCGCRLYAGATGNDVMHILLALKHSASKLPEHPLATDDKQESVERLQHVTIEVGSDARLFSNTYATPMKIYVKNMLIYDSELHPEKRHNTFRRYENGPTRRTRRP